jgi:hypothetical protein
MDELDGLLSAISARTSLEELLDWDYELTEYLVGAWGNCLSHIHTLPDQETRVVLLVAQLPADKYEKYEKKIEKWLHDNYNMVVR